MTCYRRFDDGPSFGELAVLGLFGLFVMYYVVFPLKIAPEGNEGVLTLNYMESNTLIGTNMPNYPETYISGDLIDKGILCLIECESEGNPDAWNKKDPNGGSKGILQFQEPTFYHYAKEVGIKNPDIWNPEQQIEVATYLFSENKQYLWTCAQKCGISGKK